jgi:predicted dehydrogenase
MAEIKAAVIGVGSMGTHHARVYSEIPDVELVGIADIDAAAVERISRRHGCPAYTDFRALLDEQKPEIVSVAVPTAMHLPVALEVTQRGIHLLVEKPIAPDVGEGLQIIQAAERTGVHLMVGHIERFNPAILALKERLEAGELGQIFQIEARREGPFPTRVNDVGVTIDLAVHDLDIIRYVTGAEIERVYAETERHVHQTHEDMLNALIRLRDGTVGTLVINWLTPTKIRELYITGERGMFRVNYITQDMFFYENGTVNDESWQTLQILRGVSEGRMISHVIKKREPLRVELEAFLAAIQGKASVAVSGQDSLKVLMLARALVHSGTENRPILVDDLIL